MGFDLRLAEGLVCSPRPGPQTTTKRTDGPGGHHPCPSDGMPVLSVDTRDGTGRGSRERVGTRGVLDPDCPCPAADSIKRRTPRCLSDPGSKGDCPLPLNPRTSLLSDEHETGPWTEPDTTSAETVTRPRLGAQVSAGRPYGSATDSLRTGRPRGVTTLRPQTTRGVTWSTVGEMKC